jgi:hypothetical protein
MASLVLRLAALFTGLALLVPPSHAQMEITREIKVEDWMVFHRKNLWTDETDIVAFSRRVKVPAKPGEAGLAMFCGGPDWAGLQLEWPSRVPDLSGTGPLRIRVGSAPPQTVWLTIIRNDTAFIGEAGRHDPALDRNALFAAAEITMGSTAENLAARVPIRGMQAAWALIRESCAEAPQ